MSDKRYYWVKLKEGFFDSNEVMILENNKNGSKYLHLFLKLLLLSANSDGWFITKAGEETMPWTPKTLSKSLTGFSVKDIREGIALLLSVGLIYEVDGLLRISDFENYVGSETTAAARMRKSRKKESEKSEGKSFEVSNDEECSDFSKEVTENPESIYSTETESDSNFQTNAGDGDVHKSFFNKENKNNAVQSYSNSKGQKLIEGGFYNKKVKKQYEVIEWDIKHLLNSSFKSKPFYYNDTICDRFVGIAREISRHESYMINSSPISSEELLKSLCKLITINGKLLFKAFQKLDELLETTEVKNVLMYTITFLYNESFGCSQRGTS